MGFVLQERKSGFECFVIDVVDLHIIGDVNGEYVIDTNTCQAVDYEGAIWARTFLRKSTEMLADSKYIREVIGKEVEERGKLCLWLINFSNKCVSI